FALVEWPDNIAISDASPAEYFPRFVEERQLASAELAQMQYWHALPDGWHTMPYDHFLSLRRQAIARVIRDGFKLLGGVSTCQAASAAAERR
ncbi:MAG: GmrSD restriction endonuclease domain-containing protein, partial [Chloroflexota bacterium]